MLYLMKPECCTKEQINDLMKEWQESGECIMPFSIRRKDFHDFSEYIASFHQLEQGCCGVPSTTFFVWESDLNQLVGAVDIRHYLNDYLMAYGGHIGTGVRPSQRGKGYGTEMIRLSLDICRQLELDKVLITCNRDNMASARTIQKNGGLLEDERKNTEGEWVQRYWIQLEQQSGRETE